MAEKPDADAKKAKYTRILEEATERFKLAKEADSSWREKSLDDLRFSTLDQWPMNIRSQREKEGRPCLTMDQLQQSIRLVCNQYRQAPPALQVNPRGNGATQDIAEVLQGITRHIETNSEASEAYEWAHECVVRSGHGSWRLLNDYVDDESDEQDIFIEPIRNQFSVYWQPGVKQKDAKWCFLSTDVPHDTYKADNPDSQEIFSLVDFTSTGDPTMDWVTKEYVRVVEYFCIEEEKVAGKKRPKKTVYWYKLNAKEILDERTLPGTSIPVFTAYGDDIDVDGERYLCGLVRAAKDPQRMYNYWTSAATEKIALSKTAPWKAVEGTIVNPGAWENPDSVRVLYYKQVDVGGKPAPEPTRELLEPAIDSMAHMTLQAQGDIKSSMGIYDPSLGQRKGDESGKAIEKLQQQGSIATMNYSDNVARTMKRFGKVLLEWIQEIYDTARIQRIINPDGTTQNVIVHQESKEEAEELQRQNAVIKKIYDIGVGTYDITVNVGPSYQTKRQEAVATQMDLLKVIPPQMVPSILDLVVRNTDIPQSKEIADRIKKMLPPQLQDEGDNDPQVTIQKLQATNQQLSQQHELLSKALQQATEVVKTKQIEQQGKMQVTQLQEEFGLAKAKLDNETKILISEISTKAQSAQERAQLYLDEWKELHNTAHDAAMSSLQQAHEKDLATQQAQNAQQSQQSDQAHEAGMTAANQAHESEMAAQTQGDE